MAAPLTPGPIRWVSGGVSNALGTPFIFDSGGHDNNTAAEFLTAMHVAANETTGMLGVC